MEKEKRGVLHIVSSQQNWLEGEAVRQLELSAALDGMCRVVGMPDLHPGKGFPIGAGFISKECLYPHLVGSDIGCGIALYQSNIKHRKIKRDKLANRIKNMEGPWEGDIAALLEEFDLKAGEFDKSLGTIGGGNHFAEVQRIESIEDPQRFADLGLDKDKIFVAIHSGSRGLGHAILQEHLSENGAKALLHPSPEADDYIEKHNHALQWAKLNRHLIAKRLSDAIRAQLTPIIDLFHNTVLPIDHQGELYWLHRKGAAPADQGPVLIPGSRGTFSYIVQPLNPRWETAFSLAHGAGRKWKRSDTKARLKNRYTSKALEITELGSRVICSNKDLLYQEAPQAYKDVQVVIQDMVEAEMISVIAVLRPIITYKVAK